MGEITLLLLHNNCSGFAPTGHASSTPLSFPTPRQQKDERWQRWQHSLFHLAAATTGSAMDSDDTTATSISSILATNNDKNQTRGMVAARYLTQSTSFSLELPPLTTSSRRKAWNSLKKKILSRRNRNNESGSATSVATTTLGFDYDYDIIDLPVGTDLPASGKTTGIMLIHPIGVGIARWYYQRLVSSLVARHARIGARLVIVVPDLLGSGSACNATAGTQKFPLFNISDWTDQLEALMSTVEIATTSDGGSGKIDHWCVIANGGCSPIALKLAQRKKLVERTDMSEAPVSNLILSSVPRLSFFLKNETTNDPAKVAKSYRTLSGVPGNLFWWYSCRNDGAFIQTFSEKNLIADPKNLGPNWRPNCCETALSFDGKGKYATFSFLAGTLQDGCLPSLETVKDTPLKIDIIKGVDVRRNRAKSWFWQKPKKKDEKNPRNTNHEKPEADQASGATAATPASDTDTSNTDDPTNKNYETFRDYAEKNGNGGRELVIGGRISLAHEDPEGYADAILQFLFGP